MPDCKNNGWILDGCPTTNEQIAALNEMGLVPSLVITMDQSDSSVYEKIEQRRFDPVECSTYDLLKDEVPKEAQHRLIQQKEHTHPFVKRRLQEYRHFLATIETEYKKNLIRINAEESENDNN
jgi:adenylate kinase family enzyme